MTKKTKITTGKNIISLLFILIFHFGIISCTNDKEEAGEVPIVKINFDKSNIISDSIFMNTRYIPLETKDECIIGGVNKLKIIDDCIYAMDLRYNLGIYKFDINGNFLFKISNIGKGPGEFIEINDFFITEKFIIVLAFKKLLFYSKFNGEFEYEKTLDFMPDNISFDKDRTAFFFQNRELGPNKLLNSHIVITNSNFKPKEEYLKVYRREMIEPDRLYEFNGDIYLSAPRFMENILYQLNDNMPTPIIKFDFGKDNSPSSYISDRSINVIDMIPYPSISKVIPSNKFGMFKYLVNNRIYLGFYSTETYSSISGYAFKTLPVSISNFDQIIDNEIVSHTEASSFIKRISIYESYNPNKYIQYFDKNSSFRAAIKGINEYSNPVVVINEIDTELLLKILK